MTGQPDMTVLLSDAGVAAAMLGPSPAWLWDVAAGRVVLANGPGIDFLGATDASALLARRFDMRRPPLAQLVALAPSLRQDGAPRLSLLRFFVGARDLSVPCQCRRVGSRGRDLVVVQATGVGAGKAALADRAAATFEGLGFPVLIVGSSGEAYRNSAAAAAGLQPGSHHRSVAVDLPEGRFDVFVGQQSASVETVEGSLGEAEIIATGPDDAAHAPLPVGSTERPEEPVPPLARRDRVPETKRFTFQIDPDGRFVEVGAGFAALVGPRAADIVGRTWHDIEASLGLDPKERMSKALASRDTWSNIQIVWPTDFGERATLRLSALPRFAEGRAFAGYRGFADLMSLTRPDMASETVSSPDTSTAEPETHAAKDEQESGRQFIPANADQDATGAAAVPVQQSESASEIPATAPAAMTEPDLDGVGPEAQPRAGETPSPRVFRLRTTADRAPPGGTLNDHERSAFAAIADALGAHWSRMSGPARSIPSEDDAEPEPGSAEAQSATAVPAAERVAPPAAETGADTQPITDPEEIGAGPGVEEEVAVATPDVGEPGGQAQGAETDLDEAFVKAAAGAPVQIAQPHDAGRGSADVLKEVLDRIALGLAVVRDQTILHANRAFLDLFGYEDLEDLDIAGGIGALLEGREPGSAPGSAVAARKRDGGEIRIEARLGRTPWIDGPAMLMSVRIAAAEAPAADAPRLDAGEMQAVLDIAADGVLMLDAEGRVVSANAGAVRLLGIEASKVVGTPLTELVGTGFRAAVADRLDGLGARQVPSVLGEGLEVELSKADDAPVAALLSLAAIGDGNGPTRICAVLRDIDAWKRTEADLTAARKGAEAASAQKSDFLAKVSHEIRTPLNGIIGFSEIILEERFGPIANERYRDYLKDIRQSGEHLMSLVNDLLDLSKIEAGKLDLAFTEVRLNDVVEQAVAVMQPQSSRARVIIRSSLYQPLPAVVADLRSLRQVLLNLLSNAIKFTPTGGQVIVSTARGEAGQVILRVRDTGVGMSQGDVATALEPFRQLPVAANSDERGTGLGLPLAKALVEANRAAFDLRSKPGEGTLVEISFPQPRVLDE
jgi:PAS domain S-box-containing protein